jgi:hypothetical protein
LLGVKAEYSFYIEDVLILWIVSRLVGWIMARIFGYKGMDVLTAIRRRRNIRSFTGERIPNYGRYEESRHQRW